MVYLFQLQSIIVWFSLQFRGRQIPLDKLRLQRMERFGFWLGLFFGWVLFNFLLSVFVIVVVVCLLVNFYFLFGFIYFFFSSMYLGFMKDEEEKSRFSLFFFFFAERRWGWWFFAFSLADTFLRFGGRIDTEIKERKEIRIERIKERI